MPPTRTNPVEPQARTRTGRADPVPPTRWVRPDVPGEGVPQLRLFGGLHAVRADGSPVALREWRTAQTTDLLRLLALRAGSPVPVDLLVDTLWPTADRRHGRASLRTAASVVRRALGERSVERQLDGLVLTGVWVDTRAFSRLAAQVGHEVASGRSAAAVTSARAAVALYTGDFHAHDDGSAWAERERELLSATLHRVVVEATDAAASIGWWQDTLQLAERSLQLEPCSERAHRAVMRARAGRGEGGLALKAFEACRSLLAEELGVDPAPETRDLHMQLLTGTVPPPAARLPTGGDQDPALARAAGGPVSAALLARARQDGGSGGQVLAGLRSWAAAGRLVSGPAGLELMGGGHAAPVEPLLVPPPSSAAPPPAAARGSRAQAATGDRPDGGRIRLMLVDDHRTLGDLLRISLAGVQDIDFLAQAGTVADGLRLARELRPDVVLMDYCLPDGDGVTAACSLLGELPDVRVVMLTATEDRRLLARAGMAGVSAFLLKTGSLDDVLGAVRTARRGAMSLHSDGVFLLAQEGAGGGQVVPQLTRRELLVLTRLGEGRALASIARELDISVSTSRGYVKTLLLKLGVHSQLEAVAAGHRLGLLGRVG